MVDKWRRGQTETSGGGTDREPDAPSRARCSSQAVDSSTNVSDARYYSTHDFERNHYFSVGCQKRIAAAKGGRGGWICLGCFREVSNNAPNHHQSSVQSLGTGLQEDMCSSHSFLKTEESPNINASFLDHRVAGV